jgi:hypothetical protein
MKTGHPLFSLYIQPTHNFVRNLAECKLEMGMTFSAGSHANFVSSRVQIEELERPSNARGGVASNLAGCQLEDIRPIDVLSSGQ